jgi:hypothetical protein
MLWEFSILESNRPAALGRNAADRLEQHSMGKFDECLFSKQPLPCVLDDSDTDRLLQKLRAVHGDAGRPDIAPELTARGEQRYRRHELA